MWTFEQGFKDAYGKCNFYASSAGPPRKFVGTEAKLYLGPYDRALGPYDTWGPMILGAL